LSTSTYIGASAVTSYSSTGAGTSSYSLDLSSFEDEQTAQNNNDPIFLLTIKIF
jgi:hypothetical protein